MIAQFIYAIAFLINLSDLAAWPSSRKPDVSYAAKQGLALDLLPADGMAVGLLQTSAFLTGEARVQRTRTQTRTHTSARQETMSPTSSVKQKQKVVWINSFGRSGSSVLLELLEQVDLPVFGLFEPCRDVPEGEEKDILEPWLVEKGCAGLLSQLVQCNFTGITELWGWNHPYSKLNGAGSDYSPDAASKACLSAGVVIFKTIDWGHNLTSEAIPFLEANPHVHMIDLVRDPRSIYASELTLGWTVDTKHLLDLCDLMSENLNKSHSQMTRVVYEQFVTKPSEIAAGIFSFIGMPAELQGANFSKYVKNNFDSDGCHRWNELPHEYTNCRTNSSGKAVEYSKLPNEEYTAFMKSASCSSVSLFYDKV
mmetsp:Transcript_21446/g.36746  ORF Transcript_21446/g.36746 Transcript_21446/m.36746 type:complete len:367 (-) Transcript_21446:91-1191(-)